MKTISRIAIGAAAVLLLVATLPPVEAACATPRLLDYAGAYVTSNPNWGGYGGTGTCGFGCYQSDSSAAISSSISGVFWGFNLNTVPASSAADPALASGIDNGSWDASFWTKARSGAFTNGTYYYPAWLSVDAGSDNQPGNPPNWASNAIIDGCPNDIDPDACTCFIATDQWGGEGYFMVDSAISDPIGNFTYDGLSTDAGGRATVRMLPMPVPLVTNSVRDATTADVTLTVTVAAFDGAADYRDAGCDCGLGYKIYYQTVGRGGMAPLDRIDGWIEATSVTGGAQAMTAFGQATDVVVDCDPALQQDLYIATMIVEENGLVGGNVSANSLLMPCGANLAEPDRPDRSRGRSADAPRGRDNNRGQRDR